MKILTGVELVHAPPMKFHGVLPEVPAVADSSGADLATLDELPRRRSRGDPWPSRGDDTYWTGKGLGRAARIAEIADQLGDTATRDTALDRHPQPRSPTGSPPRRARPAELFYYDQQLGHPDRLPGVATAPTRSSTTTTSTTATSSPRRRRWPSSTRPGPRPSQYGGMVDLLIRDANNYDRADTRFPYLRDFDIYAGHDWASGHGAFGAGNNQESSSEGMNFANALIQWGQATGNTAVRDAGIFIYTTQAAAIQEYWFDVDATRTSRPPSGTPRSAWSGATAARTPPGSAPSRR